MNKQQVILRGVVGLIGHATAAASAMREDKEADYLAARVEFDATCIESERLLEQAEQLLTDARLLTDCRTALIQKEGS